MKKLPLGIQNFKEIAMGDYVYVDKTQHIYNLINGAKNYFLSRPRRFGKSLLLDTIGEAFGGEKELFRGLWIYDSDYAFERHPVIRLDMSNIPNETSEILKSSLLDELNTRVQREELNIGGTEPAVVFKRIIEKLHGKYGQRVVVLIDEYDKPIWDHIDDIETAEANRKVLRGFYGILKSMDPYLRFTFLTGVSKFTKTSVFSDLNNLVDITMAGKFTNICGINALELGKYFSEHIESIKALKNSKDSDSVLSEILSWYDGYSWDGENRVINPFSLLNFFEQEKFESFWYSSGTPKFMIDLIKKKPESFLALRNLKLTERVLDTFDIQKIELEPLLFQAGYLTVKETMQTRGAPIYLLGIPNFEVRDAFNMQLLSAMTESGDVRTEQSKIEIGEALQSGDLRKMLDILRGLFASIPYQLHVSTEAYYHSIFYAAMTILGFDMDVEVSTSKGRVDAVLELEDKVYVMEFKYQSCPAHALAEEKQKLFTAALREGMDQIRDIGYHKKYISSGKTIYLAAFAFLGRDDIELKAEVF
ncbi:MAG: ATP-binding protein [Oscillospiraceae bacterium]|nr:ATP-binding protein [Oscillospiraceae bacterium]